MGLYKKYFLPRFLNATMQKEAMEAERRTYILPFARGVVLDVGAGSATNLPFFSPQIEKVFALEPLKELWQLGKGRLAAVAFPVEYLEASAESIPLPDASIDTVVSAYSLCSIPNPLKALQEMRRVLKPNGRYIFVDHGIAPDKKIRFWQKILGPVMKPFVGGCNLDRNIDALIKQAGFTIEVLDEGYDTSPLIYLSRGQATK